MQCNLFNAHKIIKTEEMKRATDKTQGEASAMKGGETSKSFLQNLKEFLLGKSRESGPLPEEASAATVSRLIDKAVRRSGDDIQFTLDRKTDLEEKEEPIAEVGSGSDDDGSTKKESCPYATKRAIVESLEEVRRFAQEHGLASKFVKVLLAFLAEAALNALRGKVSGKVLDVLLKGFTFDQVKDDAYKAGEKDGRNARIIVEHFPEQSGVLPNINGTMRPNSGEPTIFDLAKGN